MYVNEVCLFVLCQGFKSKQWYSKRAFAKDIQPLLLVAKINMPILTANWNYVKPNIITAMWQLKRVNFENEHTY